MNRGSSMVSSRSVRSQAGFNEAPIHESGKFDDRSFGLLAS